MQKNLEVEKLDIIMSQRVVSKITGGDYMM